MIKFIQREIRNYIECLIREAGECTDFQSLDYWSNFWGSVQYPAFFMTYYIFKIMNVCSEDSHIIMYFFT